jgi:hypothetical protein
MFPLAEAWIAFVALLVAMTGMVRVQFSNSERT